MNVLKLVAVWKTIEWRLQGYVQMSPRVIHWKGLGILTNSVLKAPYNATLQ